MYFKVGYGGFDKNPIKDAAYFCYTIFDKIYGKYYSGSRGVRGRNTHDLLINYFTSSTITDFKNRLRNNPYDFEYQIEYFLSRKDAFAAETRFHSKFNVSKNPMFYNAMNSNGTLCGAGSVLCRSEDDKIYRVSVEEFSSGKHVHVSKGMMNVVLDDGTITKIKISDFNPSIHRSELDNMVVARNNKTGKVVRVNKDIFDKNPDLEGVTSGKVMAYDKVLMKRHQIDSKVFYNHPERYIGGTFGKTTVIDKSTGDKKTICVSEFDRTKYYHFNSDRVVVFDIVDRVMKKVSKAEYRANKHRYANNAAKYFFVKDGIFFKSREDLQQHFAAIKEKLPRFPSKELDGVCGIKVISREKYENEKDPN